MRINCEYMFHFIVKISPHEIMYKTLYHNLSYIKIIFNNFEIYKSSENIFNFHVKSLNWNSLFSNRKYRG